MQTTRADVITIAAALAPAVSMLSQLGYVGQHPAREACGRRQHPNLRRQALRAIVAPREAVRVNAALAGVLRYVAVSGSAIRLTRESTFAMQ
jgi:hypothetical protein